MTGKFSFYIARLHIITIEPIATPPIMELVERSLPQTQPLKPLQSDSFYAERLQIIKQQPEDRKEDKALFRENQIIRRLGERTS